MIFLLLASCVSCKEHSGRNRVWAFGGFANNI